MRRVTGSTPFSLKWRMFVGKWTLFVCVALDAGSIRACGQSRLLQFEATMGIMTITALHHALKHLVMKWLVEVRVDFRMAAQAKPRLPHLLHFSGCKTGGFRPCLA